MDEQLLERSSAGSRLLDCDDDELMTLAQGGTREAFHVLVKRHQGRALQVAARNLTDATMARDVTQQAFLELFRGLHRYHARGKFTAYLYRIVVNQCRMIARARNVARRWLLLAPREPEASTQTVMLRVERQKLEHALSQLTEKHRIVVILRHSRDLSLLEIAETLELPLGTVKRRLFEAMEQLRAALGREF